MIHVAKMIKDNFENIITYLRHPRDYQRCDGGFKFQVGTGATAGNSGAGSGTGGMTGIAGRSTGGSGATTGTSGAGSA